MTRDEAKALSEGDLVRHKSGNVYRVWALHGSDVAWRGLPLFHQQRDGQNYGPLRRLSPESITRVANG
jgi:hypothetical protein